MYNVYRESIEFLNWWWYRLCDASVVGPRSIPRWSPFPPPSTEHWCVSSEGDLSAVGGETCEQTPTTCQEGGTTSFLRRHQLPAREHWNVFGNRRIVDDLEGWNRPRLWRMIVVF